MIRNRIGYIFTPPADGGIRHTARGAVAQATDRIGAAVNMNIYNREMAVEGDIEMGIYGGARSCRPFPYPQAIPRSYRAVA